MNVPNLPEIEQLILEDFNSQQDLRRPSEQFTNDLLVDANLNILSLSGIGESFDGYLSMGSFPPTPPHEHINSHVRTSSLSSIGNTSASGIVLLSERVIVDSDRDRHESRDSDVIIYDMRTRLLADGEHKCVNSQRQLIPQKISTMYSVLEQNLVFLKTSTESIPPVVAILDSTKMTNITVFILWDDRKSRHKCVTLTNCATTEILMNMVADASINPVICRSSSSYLPFSNGQKLHAGLLLDQGVLSGSEIVFRVIQNISLRCLYRASSKTEIVYHVDCRSTDSIKELKNTIIQTVKEESDNASLISKLLPDNVWLTRSNRLYHDTEYIGSSVLTDISNNYLSYINSNCVNLVINVQPNGSIPVNVHYNNIVEKIILSTELSSANLRYEISKLMHCSPDALKISINKKKLPELDCLSNFNELNANCNIVASLRPDITVYVNFSEKKETISVMKLGLVLTLKQKLAKVIQKPLKQIKLCFEEKELNDYSRLDQVHIKNSSEVTAELFERRIIISVRKCASDTVHFIIDDCNKLSIRELKMFYKRTIKLSPIVDVNFHSFKNLLRFEDDMCLSDLGVIDMETICATVKPMCPVDGSLIRIFDYQNDGQLHVKKGAIISGYILYASDDSPIHEYPTEAKSPEVCCINGIRIAHPHEIFGKYSRTTCTEQPTQNPNQQRLFLNLTHVPVNHLSLSAVSSPPVSIHSNELITHSNTTPDLREPQGVVSDQDLDKLIKCLPGYDWQPFMRELLTSETITKYIESYICNVSEQMFQCLKAWKRKMGKRATTSILRNALKKHDLTLISQQVFGEEVQSD